MIFRIYDVEFKQKKDLFLALGYSCPVGSAVVNKQYKGLENLIKIRLNLSDDKAITDKLQELRNNYYKMLELNKDKDVTTYKRIKAYIYDCYLASWHQLPQEKRDVIIQTVASLNNIDPEVIRKDI